MSPFKTLDDLNPRGKTVLLRADLNVPVQDGKVSDDTRITRLVPTIRELTGKGAKVVILSHFGRPKGKDLSSSLAIVRASLVHALGQKVGFADDCIGDAAKASISPMKPGDVTLLENVRFHAEEEKDDPGFAAKVAALGDIYVNDAFSAAHRAHATTHALARLLPAYAGRLMEAELTALNMALGNPRHPVAAIVGGAKISTKLDLLHNLVAKVDILILGGGMANTFLHAKGIHVGKSLCEHDMADAARAVMEKAKSSGCKLVLPVDGVVAEEFKENAPSSVVNVNAIPPTSMMLDVGPASVTQIIDALKTTKTLVWNGPLGAFETKPFDAATLAVARAVAKMTAEEKLISIAGGGDTVAALNAAGVEDALTYVSAAGGAFLEWMEGKELPGVAALMCPA